MRKHLDWNLETDGPEYTQIRTEGVCAGTGIPGIDGGIGLSEPGDDFVTAYVQVPDVAEALQWVVAIGAQVDMPLPRQGAWSSGSSATPPATGLVSCEPRSFTARALRSSVDSAGGPWPPRLPSLALVGLGRSQQRVSPLARVLALRREFCLPRLHRLARSTHVDGLRGFGRILAAGPVQPFYSLPWVRERARHSFWCAWRLS